MRVGVDIGATKIEFVVLDEKNIHDKNVSKGKSGSPYMTFLYMSIFQSGG